MADVVAVVGELRGCHGHPRSVVKALQGRERPQHIVVVQRDNQIKVMRHPTMAVDDDGHPAHDQVADTVSVERADTASKELSSTKINPFPRRDLRMNQ